MPSPTPGLTSPQIDAKNFTFKPLSPPPQESRERQTLVLSPTKTPVTRRQCSTSPLQDNALNLPREPSTPNSPNDTVFTAFVEELSKMGPQNAYTIRAPRSSIERSDSGSAEPLDSPPTEKPAKSTAKRKLPIDNTSNEPPDRQHPKQHRTINPDDLKKILKTLQKEREQEIR